MALIGCVSVVLFYFFLDNVTPLPNHRKYVLFGTLLFAICPWHIMKSRWGLESNLFPDLILWGSFCLSIFAVNTAVGQDTSMLPLSSLTFRLIVTAPSYCFLPFLYYLFFFTFFAQKDRPCGRGILALVLLTLVALPIILLCSSIPFSFLRSSLGPLRFHSFYQNCHTEEPLFLRKHSAEQSEELFPRARCYVFQHDSLPWERNPSVRHSLSCYSPVDVVGNLLLLFQVSQPLQRAA